MRIENGKQCILLMKSNKVSAIKELVKTQRFTSPFMFQAALFGKSFVPEMNPEPCKKTIFTLRVLNAVRDFRVGKHCIRKLHCSYYT